MRSSPYRPGAGTLPPVLAGRDRLLQRLMLGLNDVAAVGRVRTQDVILIGPRGVGKTVAVSAYGEQARASGFEGVNLQAVSGRAGLVPSLLERAASGTRGKPAPRRAPITPLTASPGSAWASPASALISTPAPSNRVASSTPEHSPRRWQN